MAAPHVSGTVALMLQARPDLTVDDLLEILIGTAVADDRYGPLPNTRYGWGRIDAYAAVAEASLTSGVRGTVRDEKTGRRLAGVTVHLPNNGRTITTDSDGAFELRLAAGTYDLRLSRFGYHNATQRVRVRVDRYTDVRFELEQTRRGSIAGKVVYGPTGLTVPGTTVRIQDVPDELVATTDRSGRYTLRNVPVGSYQVVATAPGISKSAPAAVTVRGDTARKDLTLPRPFPTERYSLSTDGRQGNGDSWWPELSADGSVVAYGSFASNLVPEGDTNGEPDVYLTDLRTRTTERISLAPDGSEANSFSLTPTLSANGRFVGYNSGASNLVPGDTNEQTDSFVHDRQTRITERVSVATDGTASNGLSYAPVFSADGRYVAFGSEATNLVAGDTNGGNDIFVRDRQTGVTERVSVASDGTEGNASSREYSISGDGRYVAFHSDATNLVAGDTNEFTDVFLHDRQTGVTERIPAPRNGESREPVISADGRTVVFTNRTGPFGTGQLVAYDRQTGTSELVSVAMDGGDANDSAYGPVLSADGRTIAFNTAANNLAPNSAPWRFDVYVRDRDARTTTRVSSAPDGTQDGWGELPAISGDGRYVSFQSSTTNLVEGDNNRRSDIFVHDRIAGPQARFALSGLTITPDVTRGGRPVHVSAWLKNVGETTGAYDAVLQVDGVRAAQRSVTVGSGREVRVSFEIRPSKPGTHSVKLGSLTGQFRVR
jgi:Tol biopolymer transport system component